MKFSFEPGDILVFKNQFYPETQKLFHYTCRGMAHIALIVRVLNKGLMQVHSPPVFNSKNLNDFLPYDEIFVLRIKKQFSKSMNSRLWPESISSVRSASQYEVWRKKIIKGINKTGVFLSQQKIIYDNDRITELVLPRKASRFMKMIRSRRRLKKIRFYCSNFVWTPFALEGFPLPSGATMPILLKLMDRDLNRILGTQKRLPRHFKKVKNYVANLVYDRELLLMSGADDETLNRLEKFLIQKQKPGRVFDSPISKSNFNLFFALLKIPSHETQRRTQVIVRQSHRFKERGKAILVPNIFDFASREGSPFECVGRFSLRRKFKSKQKPLKKLFMHTFPISHFVSSPNRKWVATTSADELVRLVELKNFKTYTIHLWQQTKSLSLTNKELFIEMESGRVQVFLLSKLKPTQKMEVHRPPQPYRKLKKMPSHKDALGSKRIEVKDESLLILKSQD